MTDIDLHQPPLPPGQRCAICDKLLDMAFHSGTFWSKTGLWYCLPCFARKR